MPRHASPCLAGSQLRRARRLVNRTTTVAMMSLGQLFPSVAAAQPQGVSGGITLQTALETTLSQSSQVQLGEREVQMGLGALLGARAPFDAQLTTSIAAQRENSVTPSTGGEFASALTSTVSYAVELPKRLRSGVVLTPRIGLTRIDVANIPGALTSRATVNLDLLVPLLQDRGGGVTAAPERAAEHGYEASLLEARHAKAASILATAAAYWNELAAEQQLEVYRSSEARAQQLVDETRILVASDERPAADMEQLLANLALKRAARITGEQAEIQARQQLGLAMGMDERRVAAMTGAATGFPDVPPDTGISTGPTDDAIAAALRMRADLAALSARRLAATVQLAAARSGLRPRLDLAVDFGYTGLAADGGVDGAISSFYRNIPGLDASVQLSYGIPLAKVAARGAALRGAAAYDQARIREADLVRQISSGVVVAGEALRHSRLALRSSREAVTLSRRAVENEKRKFQLGMSTLFDVILAEDALTSARLGEIAGQHDYAVAIARLRYESGSLLIIDGTRLTVSADSITSPP